MHDYRDHPLYNTRHMGGYLYQDLQAAFAEVQDKTNWKRPIDAIVPINAVAITEAAIAFIAGGQARFTKVRGRPDYYRVRAPGYYKIIGA